MPTYVCVNAKQDKNIYRRQYLPLLVLELALLNVVGYLGVDMRLLEPRGRPRRDVPRPGLGLTVDPNTLYTVYSTLEKETIFSLLVLQTKLIN